MDTPLNKAHFYARRAMQLNSEQKIEYIQKTIDNLGLALQQTNSPKATESITLQKEYYEKQLTLLNFKKNFKVHKMVRQQKAPSDDDNAAAAALIDINERVAKATDIQLDLFKNMEASDAMLAELKQIIPDNANFKMNDLEKMNLQFNELFQQLIICVDETLSENERLKERLRAIDEERQDNAAVVVGSVVAARLENLAQERGEPHQREFSDSSPEDMQELPPLDLPEFNLDSLGQ